jgi:hypothetical protein
MIVTAAKPARYQGAGYRPGKLGGKEPAQFQITQRELRSHYWQYLTDQDRSSPGEEKCGMEHELCSSRKAAFQVLLIVYTVSHHVSRGRVARPTLPPSNFRCGPPVPARVSMRAHSDDEVVVQTARIDILCTNRHKMHESTYFARFARFARSEAHFYWVGGFQKRQKIKDRGQIISRLAGQWGGYRPR